MSLAPAKRSAVGDADLDYPGRIKGGRLGKIDDITSKEMEDIRGERISIFRPMTVESVLRSAIRPRSILFSMQ